MNSFNDSDYWEIEKNDQNSRGNLSSAINVLSQNENNYIDDINDYVNQVTDILHQEKKEKKYSDIYGNTYEKIAWLKERRIKKSSIELLLSKVNIADIAASLWMKLNNKPGSKNRYVKCFTSHDEKTGSLCFIQDKQFYYCFWCGASGNAIELVMEYSNTHAHKKRNFFQAVHYIKKVTGIKDKLEYESVEKIYKSPIINKYDRKYIHLF